MADVFISYKSNRRPAAEHFAEVLAAYGYSVWWDYGLVSGHDFGPQIENELRGSRAVVVLWCSLAVQSEWVREEAALAKRLHKLVPTMIEKIELPLGFSLAQTLDLSAWDGAPESPHLERLLRDIAALVGREPREDRVAVQRIDHAWRRYGAPPLSKFALIDPLEAKTPPRVLPTSINPPPPPPAPSRRAAIIAGGAAAVLVGGYAVTQLIRPRAGGQGQIGEAEPAPSDPTKTTPMPGEGGAPGASPPPPPHSPPLQTGPLSISASANPNIVAPGGETEIAAYVTDQNNNPVANAQVVVGAGGGVFTATGATRVTGRTDGGGVFRTRWITNAPSAYTGNMSYVMGVDASKEGMQPARVEVTVFIRL